MTTFLVKLVSFAELGVELILQPSNNASTSPLRRWQDTVYYMIYREIMQYPDTRVTMNCVDGCVESVVICNVDKLNTCHVFLFIIQLKDGIVTVWNRSPFLGLCRGRGYVVFITIMQNHRMLTPMNYVQFSIKSFICLNS